MERVVFHSSLLGTGLTRDDLPEFHDFVMSLINPNGTLVVPSYTLGDQVSPFDSFQTPSVGVGAYSEFVRKLPHSIRSASPLHSHCAVGADAGLLEKSSVASFGPGSDFELFEAHDFWLVLFNTSFTRGATVLHHVEAICDVPYRKNIEIQRMIREGGVLRRVVLKYPARIDPTVQTDFDRIVPLLESKASSFMHIHTPNLGGMSVVRIAELVEVGSRTLKENPNFFRVDCRGG